MPNYCSNKLIITSQNPQILLKFKKEAVPENSRLQEVVSLQKLYPQDKTQDNRIEWQTNNWGTKWDLINTEILEETAQEICYCFETAWSPPVEAFIEISKNYPEITFKLYYEESGNDFIGYTEIENGESLINRELNYWDRYCCHMSLVFYEVKEEEVHISIKKISYKDPANVMDEEKISSVEVIVLNIEKSMTMLRDCEYNTFVEDLDIFGNYVENEAFANLLTQIDFIHLLDLVKEKQKIDLLINKKVDNSILKI